MNSQQAVANVLMFEVTPETPKQSEIFCDRGLVQETQRSRFATSYYFFFKGMLANRNLTKQVR